MGGNYYYDNNNNNNNKKQTKSSSSSSSFSMFSLFKIKRSRSRVVEEAPSNRRVWPREGDYRGRWPVAEPGIDRRAEDFIAKIHRNIATDSERKTVTIPSTTTATAKA